MEAVMAKEGFHEPCSHFGGCPVCGNASHVLNVERDHYYTCDEHKKRWRVGSNLFSSWRHENEETWEENKKVLEGYEEVDPVIGPEVKKEENKNTGNDFLYLRFCRKDDLAFFCKTHDGDDLDELLASAVEFKAPTEEVLF
jgi:hypothetical protein